MVSERKYKRPLRWLSGHLAVLNKHKTKHTKCMILFIQNRQIYTGKVGLAA